MSDPAEPLVAHRGVAVLEVASGDLLEHVAQLVPLEDFILARISEREIVVDPARVGELAALLSERGLTPLMRKIQPPVRRGPAVMDEDDTEVVG